MAGKGKNAGPASQPATKFALGSRPAILRSPPLERQKAPKAPNTRDYGMKTPPATAIQPGNPMPPMQNSNSRVGGI